MRVQQTAARSFSRHDCLSPSLNPLTATLRPQSNGPLYSNMVICALAVDGWAVTYGTARMGGPAHSSHRCTKCNSPRINSQCTNFDVARWLGGRASDLRSRSRGFEARPRRCCATTLGKLFTPYCLCHQAV